MKKKAHPLDSRKKPKLYLCGLDFLKVSLWLDWKNPEFKAMLKERKESWNDEQINKNPQAMIQPIEFDDEHSFNIQATGAGPYPYVIKCGDITILFSNHKSDAQFPNCRIEIGSMSCWHPGWLKLYNRITRWLVSHGAPAVRGAAGPVRQGRSL